MSAHLVITCDIGDTESRCAAQLAVDTTDLETAERRARGSGWAVATSDGRARCPFHAGNSQRP